MNPVAGGDAADENMIAGGESADTVDIKASRANGNVAVCDVMRAATDGGGGPGARDLDERILITGGGLEDGPGSVRAAADTAQHNAARGNPDGVRARVGPGGKQHC